MASSLLFSRYLFVRKELTVRQTARHTANSRINFGFLIVFLPGKNIPFPFFMRSSLIRQIRHGMTLYPPPITVLMVSPKAPRFFLSFLMWLSTTRSDPSKSKPHTRSRSLCLPRTCPWFSIRTFRRKYALSD